MLLCIAMLLSFAVMPVGAVETTNPQSVATQQENGVAEGTPYEKFTLALDNVNYYEDTNILDTLNGNRDLGISTGEFLNYLCLARAGAIEAPAVGEGAYEAFYSERLAWWKDRFAEAVLAETRGGLLRAGARVLAALPGEPL